MFCRTIWSLVLLYGYIGSSRVLTTAAPEIELEIHRKMPRKIEYTETEDANRIKRNIALIDEDFDVPPRLNNGVREPDGIFNEVEHEITFEGSGDEIDKLPDKHNNIRKSTTAESEHRTSKAVLLQTETVRTTHSSSKTTVPSEVIYTDIDSSGDGVLLTNVHSTTMVPTKTVQPPEETYKEVEDICLNNTCISYELYIQLPEDTSLIPEGINLTLSCKSNTSDTGILYWYKSNGSADILQTFGTGQVLHFNIPDTKTFHSGMYKCVKVINDDSCCNTESHITVYEIPLYKYHIIVLALVAAAGLLTCIYLAVRQSKAFKKYTKQFEMKHGSVKQQLL